MANTLELERIRKRYERRKTSGRDRVPRQKRFIGQAIPEREARYREILFGWRSRLADVRFLEIGAGDGNNLFFFHALGIPWNSIWANELLEDRVLELTANVPRDTNIVPGNALDIFPTNKFDVVFLSTVFSSILDRDFRTTLAGHVQDLVTPGGMILWYDFVFNNPVNPDVRGVGRRELRRLFRACRSIRFHSATLAPPIGRRIGNWYGIVNRVAPFLRTHIIAEIRP